MDGLEGIEGLQEALGAIGDDDVSEEVEEVEEDVEGDAGDESEEISEDASQSNDSEYNDLSKDALGQALAALREKESELARVHNELQVAKMASSRPVFIPYDRLPDDARQAFDAAADAYGIPVEQLVFQEYRSALDEYQRKVSNVESTAASAAQRAMSEVDSYFQKHKNHAEFGKEVAAKLLELGWEHVDKLAKQDPVLFEKQAKVMIDLAYRDLAIQRAESKRNAQAKQAMKASTRSEASRSKATVSNKSSQSMGDFTEDQLFSFLSEASKPLSEKLKRR